ncbi:NAD kinase [Vairimorpha necatrix]|uniref:NAD kinase n=1 Tax=Vairimorpha necatrix TaxID=6039 RepID=A0AAX4JES3_9MICR
MFLIVTKSEETDHSKFRHLTSHISTLQDIESSMPLLDKYRAIIVLGGDGTILRLCQLYKSLPCIIPVNHGTLGFLTTYNKDHTVEDLSDRSMMKIERRRLVINSTHYFLNEIVVTSRVRRLNTFEISIKDKIDKLVLKGDSLIISTMTGSSAYNHSIHGPLLLTDDVYLINLVAPCKSLFRPLVVNIKDTVEVSCEGGLVLIDGKEHEMSRVKVEYDGNSVCFLADETYKKNKKIIDLLNNTNL